MGRPATLKVDIVADAKGVGKGVDQANSKLGKLGGAAATLGKGMALGLVGAGAAVLGLAGSTIGAASDIQQSFGALESVYGKNAKTVQKWAADAAVAVGLSKNEYANLAAVVGAQLQGMGVSQKASANQSRDLIKVGADLSATFGGSVSDAVSAVSSLLKGEADPIERYGVSIKASDVSARLAAQGLGKLTGQALKQAQAQATLWLLMEKTKTSVGAFGRESDTLAHKQQVLGAKFENIKATIGTALLPILTALAGFVSDRLLPAIGRLTPYIDDIKLGFSALWSAIKEGDVTSNGIVGKFELVGDTIHRYVLPIVASLSTFFLGTLLPAFQAVSRFILGTVVPGLQRALLPILRGIGAAVLTVTNKIRENKDSFVKLWNGIKPVITFLATKVAPVVGTIIGGAFKIMGAAIGAVVDIISGLIDLIDSAIGKIKALANAIKNNPISKGIGGIGSFVGGAASGIGKIAGGLTGGHGLRREGVVINVTGAMDPVAVARQLEQVIAAQSVRSGRVPTFSPAR